MTVAVSLPAVPLSEWRRLVYQGLGWTSLAVGVVGVVIPGLPTAPFVLMSSYLFVRSSPRLHSWLLRSRLFGSFLRDWEILHGVRIQVKITAISLMGASLVATLILIELSPVLIGVLVGLEAVGLSYILRLPVVTQLSSDLLSASAGLPAASTVRSENCTTTLRPEKQGHSPAARAVRLTSFLGRAIACAASQARAAAGDFWAEIQSVRHRCQA